MLDVTLIQLRVLREVAATGSFTAAGLALGYTQSAISRHVAGAEAAVGEALFVRGPRGVALTPPGRVLLVHAEAVLRRLEVAEAQLAPRDAAVAGRVVLGAFPTALAAVVPRALARLRDEHPALEVRLREGGTVAQLNRLRAEQVDVAVVAAGGGLDYDLSGLLADRLALGELRVAVADGHRLAARGWVTVAELAGEPWIVGRGDDTGPAFGAWPTLEEPPIVAHAVRDWPARLGLVAAGLGVAVVPGLLVAALPAGVRALRVDDPRGLRRELLAVTRAERGPDVAAVVDALAAEAEALGLDG